MTRYHFHVFNDEKTHDFEGQEHPDLQAARDRAQHDVRLLAAHSILEHGHLVLHHRIEIEQPDGTGVATIQFGDVIQVKG